MVVIRKDHSKKEWFLKSCVMIMKRGSIRINMLDKMVLKNN